MPDIPQSEIEVIVFCESGRSLGKILGEKLDDFIWAFLCFILNDVCVCVCVFSNPPYTPQTER